jgi:hypothetical protein
VHTGSVDAAVELIVKPVFHSRPLATKVDRVLRAHRKRLPGSGFQSIRRWNLTGVGERGGIRYAR